MNHRLSMNQVWGILEMILQEYPEYTGRWIDSQCEAVTQDFDSWLKSLEART